MKILLIGEKYSTNLGDGVIFLTVKSILKQQIPDLVLRELDISGRVQYDDNIEWLFSRRQRMMNRFLSHDAARAALVGERLRYILAESPDIDGIIFVGGQLFMGYFAPMIDVITSIADKKNIPIIFNACGVGPAREQQHDQLARALRRRCVKAVSLRDGETDSLFENVETVKVYDPVIELGNYSKELVTAKPSVALGINLMNPWVFDRENPERGNRQSKMLLQNVIDFCDARGISWEIYSNGGADDVDYVNGMCQQMGINSEKIAPHPQNPYQLIQTVRRYKRIIGFRMHTHIIAHSFHIPTIGFIWDKKLSDYAEATGQKDYFLPVNDTVITAITPHLEALMARRWRKLYFTSRNDRLLGSKFLAQNIGLFEQP